MAKPVSVNGIAFPTKKSLTERCRVILRQYPPGQEVNEDDFAFLLALLAHHRWRAEKIGTGVRAITVDLHPVFHTKGFSLHRTDGTETDFSFHECIRHPGQHKDFVDACRAHVQAQINAHRQAHTPDLCPVTGEPMSEGAVEVHHSEPNTFRRLVKDFVVMEGLDIERVAIEGYGDGQVEKRLADPVLAARWAEYHRRRAVLLVVSQEGHKLLSQKQVSRRAQRSVVATAYTPPPEITWPAVAEQGPVPTWGDLVAAHPRLKALLVLARLTPARGDGFCAKQDILPAWWLKRAT